MQWLVPVQPARINAARFISCWGCDTRTRAVPVCTITEAFPLPSGSSSLVGLSQKLSTEAQASSGLRWAPLTGTAPLFCCLVWTGANIPWDSMEKAEHIWWGLCWVWEACLTSQTLPSSSLHWVAGGGFPKYLLKNILLELRGETLWGAQAGLKEKRPSFPRIKCRNSVTATPTANEEAPQQRAHMHIRSTVLSAAITSVRNNGQKPWAGLI